MDYVMLKDVCTINMGQSPDSNSYNDTGGGTPFFQGNADFGKINPVVRVWCDLPTKIAHKDDILISVRAPIGALNIADRECCIGRGLAAITADESRCAKGYLWYALSSRVEELNAKGTGSTFKAISKSILAETEIPLPPLDEQRCIAAVLDKAAALIDLRKQQLAKLDELVKARFVEMFGDPVSNPMGWEKEKSENHIDLLSGYPFQSEQYSDSGTNICGGLIIMPQRIQWEECKHWPKVDGFEEYLLQEGDIVMALDRPWISEGFKIAQVDKEHLPALLIQRTARIRGIDVNQQYLFHYFVNGGFDKHSNITGSLVPHISAKDIRSFEILLPPIELQNQFADFVKQLDKSKAAIQKSLDEAQLLFDSLMQKYFG